jgi:hypothetical protein
MRTLGNFLAGVCAILFVITAVLALLFVNIERRAFSAETYKQAFERLQLYDRMPQILADALTTAIAQNPVASNYLKTFTAQNWEDAIRTLIPPEERKGVANSTLDSTFDYLNSRSNTVVVSLLPIKSHMAGPAGVDAILQLLNTQPVCTLNQIIELTLAAVSGGDLIFCNPPPQAVEVVRPLIQSQLQAMTVAIPNDITVVATQQAGGPDDPRADLRLARTVMQITPLLPMAFLLGLTLFAVRSLIDWLKWWGWPFLLTGLASILIAIPGASLFGYMFQIVMETQGFGFLPPLLLSALRETIRAIVDEILAPVAFAGFGLAAVGLLMVLAGAILAYAQRERTIPRSTGW